MCAFHPTPPRGGMGHKEPEPVFSAVQASPATSEAAAKAVRAERQNQKLLLMLCTKLIGLKTLADMGLRSGRSEE